MEQYIPWILSIVAICVTLYLSFHKEHKDDTTNESNNNKNLSIALAKMDVKQDSILNSINEMRVESKAQGNKITELEKDVILIKESTKSAHHRLDDLISSLDVQTRDLKEVTKHE